MLPFHKESMPIRNSNILSSSQNLHSMKFEINSKFTTENGGLKDYVLFWDGIIFSGYDAFCIMRPYWM